MQKGDHGSDSKRAQQFGPVMPEYHFAVEEHTLVLPDFNKLQLSIFNIVFWF